MNGIYLRIALFCLVFFANKNGANELGLSCSKDSHCSVKNSQCLSGVCSCKHYYSQLNATTCLESKLLGGTCQLKEQCFLGVANSICKNGRCNCIEGFISFRKHTCLGPAMPGDICYSNEHCHLWSKNTHCQFLIPNLFGKCKCNVEGNCKFNDSSTWTDLKQEVTESMKAETPEITSFSPIQNIENVVQSANYDILNVQTQPNTEQVSSDAFQEQKLNLLNTTFSPPFKNQTDQMQGDLTNPSRNENLTKLATTELSGTSVEENISIKKIRPSEGSEDETKNSVEYKYRVKEEKKIKAISLGFLCKTDDECKKSDPESRCIKGICDCPKYNNETRLCGSESTGCGPETFQCKSTGKCISWFFVCDGRIDCPDESDEECEGPNCPKSSFQCEKSKICVSLGVICDGIKNCPHGEDEQFCHPSQRNATQGCPKDTFQCNDGKCLPKFEFCNAIPKCSDASDESPHLCSANKFKKRAENSMNTKIYCPFKCGNQRCRSTAIVCSGRNGCGDNSDEAECTVCRCPKITKA